METYELRQRQDIRFRADVAVVGGGTAGCFAAIAAVRCGASVLLIEKNGILGGTMTVGGINFPGLFYAWGKQIVAGPCWESIKRTETLGGVTLPTFVRMPERHWMLQLRLNRAIYAHVLDSMCREDHVQVLFHTMAAHIDEERGILILCDKDGLYAVQAKCIIDCTGDANVVHMAGYPCMMSERQQPATPTNRLAGYDADTLDPEAVKEAISTGLREGKLSDELTPDQLYHYLNKYNLDVHIPCHHGADSRSKGEIETAAREKLIDILSFLKTVPGLEHIYIEELCCECGIRETRRVVGEKMVTVEEYVHAECYPDAVCYAFYPVDLHVMHGIEQTFLRQDTVPTVPYRALIPQGARRLLVAGRTVSSDAQANSALRVQVPCMAMGQAVGCAASVMAEKGIPPQEVDIRELHAKLQQIGAIIPSKDFFAESEL